MDLGKNCYIWPSRQRNIICRTVVALKSSQKRRDHKIISWQTFELQGTVCFLCRFQFPLPPRMKRMKSEFCRTSMRILVGVWGYVRRPYVVLYCTVISPQNLFHFGDTRFGWSCSWMNCSDSSSFMLPCLLVKCKYKESKTVKRKPPSLLVLAE